MQFYHAAVTIIVFIPYPTEGNFSAEELKQTKFFDFFNLLTGKAVR
ncbi:MAG: hypothetical protein ACYCTB_01465 [bacterium]